MINSLVVMTNILMVLVIMPVLVKRMWLILKRGRNVDDQKIIFVIHVFHTGSAPGSLVGDTTIMI